MNKLFYPLILAALVAAFINIACLAQTNVGVDIGNGGVDVNIGGGSIPGLPSFLGGPAYGSTSIVPPMVGGPRPTVAPGAVNGIAADPNAGGATGAGASSGTTGNFSSVPGMPTFQQAFDRPTNRAVRLPQTSMNLNALGSVDMSPVPSGQWKYGFPNESIAPFMGVSRGSIGGFLPPTSTSSVDFNTVDCPFIRGPLGGGSSGGLGNINFNIPLPGGINIGGSVNTQQAIDQVQTFFGN